MDQIELAWARARRPRSLAKEEYVIAICNASGSVAKQLILSSFEEFTAFAGEMVSIGYTTRRKDRSPELAQFDAVFEPDIESRLCTVW